MSTYRQFGKRLIDQCLSAAALMILSPVLVVIGFVVRMQLGRPVLFRQERPGLNGRQFWMVKFRTMTDDKDASGQLLSDDKRLTRFGKFLRSTSLDELPELWNVLRGEMSLVGPRPLLTEYLPHYTPEQARRHDVRPGITGWAQVHGRNDIPWETKFELDVWYVDHCSFFLDFKIMLLTVLKVIRQQGTSKQGHATTDKFTEQQCDTHRDGNLPICNRQVIVIGAGGHAKVVISTLRAAGWYVTALYDDDSTKHGERVLGVDIVGPLTNIPSGQATRAVIAIGDVECRRSIAARFSLEWLSVVHPAASVDATTKLGKGTVVCAGVVIQPDSFVGSHSIICESASIAHDCTIGDFVHLGPGTHIAGNVSIGRQSLLGTGSSVVPGVTIGDDTVVGAGAVVISDLPNNVVAVGCPAKVIRNSDATTRAA